MTLLCGFLAADGAERPERLDQTVDAMGAALRVHPGQVWQSWRVGPLGVGLLEIPSSADPSPAATPDGRWHLWMAGEAYDGGELLDGVDAVGSRTPEFRARLLAALLRLGPERIAELDGEYQIVLWDAAERVLTLLNDRFGGIPLYWGRGRGPEEGFAFAGGVRGVLAAPGVPDDPDPEAIREAVTFGGYRLGDRTNVAAVKMVPGAALVTVRPGGEPAFRRTWTWADIPEQPERPAGELIERAHELWGRAVRRRLAGAARPGQTLSGGLDSRAILAEAAPQAPAWTAITYGLPECDDARYARRAAEAVPDVSWMFQPLYSGDWLETRTGFVQATDGLIDLADLMHLETLPLQARTLDVHLSGYIGDAVAGPTFNDVADADGVLGGLPYYGGRLGIPYPEASERAAALVADLGGAAARFALFEHKLPQSTNRWSAAWRPWLRVRKPFTDYAYFDFFQGLPRSIRGQGPGEMALYERWLRERYPALFARIPNQKTGVPVLASPWRLQSARAGRFAWRQAQPALARLGLPARRRLRSYTDDEAVWGTPAARSRIEGAILRPGSLSAEIFGRAALAEVVTGWFERGAAAKQVIGALYIYETWHAGLAGHLRQARAATLPRIATPRTACQ